MTSYADWREPVRRLELGTGAATEAQRSLAAKVGLELVGDEPHGVTGVMLEEHLRPMIWGASSDPVTDRQRHFLTGLGEARATDPGLTKPVASAWIAHRLAVRNRERLRALRLARGDAVIKRTVWRHPETGLPHESMDYCVVSSIGVSGLVYFRGGNGKCGWPSVLSLATADDLPVEYPRFNPLQ